MKDPFFLASYNNYSTTVTNYNWETSTRFTPISDSIFSVKFTIREARDICWASVSVQLFHMRTTLHPNSNRILLASVRPPTHSLTHSLLPAAMTTLSTNANDDDGSGAFFFFFFAWRWDERDFCVPSACFGALPSF